MKDKKFPKMLVISTNAWRDNTGINTLIDMFKCWDSNQIAQIYAKSELPNTSVCNHFFRISENAIVRRYFNKNIVTGLVVENQKSISENEKKQVNQERRLYSQFNFKLIRSFLSIVREFVWKFGKWKTKELDRFIEEQNPDVLFVPIYPTIYMCRIQKYIMQKANVPIVSYIADDNYTYKAVSKNPVALIHRMILRRYVKYIMEQSSKVFVISPLQKEEYDRIFHIDSQVLTKGIDFEKLEENQMLNTPIKMVYTGKLIIGRWKSLAAIAEALGKINANGLKMQLDIYTTDQLTSKQCKLLNRNGCAVKGSLTWEEVRKVQRDADVVVFVESLERRYRNTARLSFSTKITDYLKSGKCIFAVGDKHIAPMDYFRRYDSAITACSYDEIAEKLQMLVEQPNRIVEYGKKAYECGIEHHSREKMNQLLIDNIIVACGSEDYAKE